MVHEYDKLVNLLEESKQLPKHHHILTVQIRRRRLARLAVGSSAPMSSSSQPGPSMAMVSQPVTSPSLDATSMDTGGTSLPQVAMDTQRSAGDTPEHSGIHCVVHAQ